MAAMMDADDLPLGSVKGTGWRRSDSGERFFRIEPGSPEWNAWLRFYETNGERGFAGFLRQERVSWVKGPSPAEHGAAQLALIARARERNAEKRGRS